MTSLIRMRGTPVAAPVAVGDGVTVHVAVAVSAGGNGPGRHPNGQHQQIKRPRQQFNGDHRTRKNPPERRFGHFVPYL